MNIRQIFLLFIVFVFVLSGCKTREKVVYLQNVPAADTVYKVQEIKTIIIRPGDKLSIIVRTEIPEMANVFNLTVPYRYVGNEKNPAGNAQTAYYTVDSDGEIEFPVLGNLKVAGMTREAISDTIKNRLVNENLLRDVIVSVEYGNLTFSVLGDVKSPGRYGFNKDRITILEALSMAQDLTITGRRDNILVTRLEDNGDLKTYRVDIRDMNKLIASPVYYIQQNDVIYVEPNEKMRRNSASGANSLLEPSFWISLVSLLSSLTTTIVAITK